MSNLTIADVTVTEGNAGAALLTFTVGLDDPAPAGGVTFDIATSDGSATAGSDYVSRAATGLTIAAGQRTATFAVTVNGDAAFERAERVNVTVTNVVGATLVDGQAIGTILNDDAGPNIGGITVYDAAVSLQGRIGAAPVATNALQLVRLGAYATTNDAATAAAPNAEVVAYDSTTASLYIQNTNENRIEIVTILASGGLAKSGEILLSGLEQYGAVNSVAVFNGLVAVAYANATGDQPGRVALFNASGTLLKSIAVGVGPDQVVFTRDGAKLLVSNEAEQFSAGSNPIGSVSIIDVSGGIAGAQAAAVTATVGFGVLNGSEASLRASGLAITPGNTAAADIEPEYITISPDNRFAYVTLQEVNGVAIIDLANPGTAPVAIQPLGSVNRSLAGNEFDATDRDGPPVTAGGNGTASINIAATPSATPIYGLLQPDAIASYSVAGTTYFITANEGDQRVIGGADNAADVARLSDVPNARLTPELQALKANPAYARLNVLLQTGDTDGDGRIDQLNTLGGRGISIFRQDADGTVTKVRETGGEFEKIFASLAPARFNNDQVVANTLDDRSDNKGPEPEGITIGTVGGRTYAFVGLERQSGVIVYDVTDPETASFVSYVPPLAGFSADLGPEVLTFIAADRNPTGTPLLVTANEVANGGATLYAALQQGYTQEVGFAPGSLAVSAAEGNAGGTTLSFTVQRSNGTLGNLAFTAELSGTGANPAARDDFSGNPALPLTIAGTIPAGAASAVVTVTVRGDALLETAETFALALRTATSSQAGVTATLSASAGTATGTILNDDTAQGAGPMPYTLQILHAADFEGGLLATERAANFAAIVDRLEDSTPNSITLSTGDGWIPSPFFIAGGDPQLAATYNGVYNQFYGLSGANSYGRLAASPGRADITIQNIIGIQAAVVGNHEFDAGPTEVANIIGAALGTAAGPADDTWVGAQFPYLSTNLNFSREAALSGLVNPNVSASTFAQTGPTSTQTGTGADKLAKSTIITENGERIAFIGATTQLEPLLTSLGNVTVDGFSGRDDIALLAQQINAEVDRVLAANPGLNKVIVGTHLQQLSNEQALAPLLRNVDVLIGGGSNTLLSDSNDRLLPGDTSQGAYPQFFTNASGQPLALVNTDGEYSYVGRLTVTFDDAGNVIRNSITAENSGAVAVDDTTVTQLYGSTAAAFTPGSKGFLVREVIEGLDANNDGVQETLGVADIIRQQDGNILGRSSVYLEGRRGEVRTEETNLGNLTSDANIWYAKQFDQAVTVSIKNGGGIRDSIGSFAAAAGGTAELPPAANPAAGKQAGDISQLDVTNSLRFNNNLSLVTVTASELERILEHGVAAVAPGATPGQFTQIGGISYSFDATRQSQTLDVNGNVTREGQRIVSAAIIDENGFLIDTLVQNGQVVGDANRAIRVVTLDFLATGTAAAPGLGGDNYPFPAYGENRVNLRDAAALSLPDTETFAAKGSEQDALAEYLKAFHAETAYGIADTGPAADTRIQNVSARADTVLQRGVAQTGTAGTDTLQGTAFSDILRGGAGDDIILNSAGDDMLMGGGNSAAGFDTLVFSTSFANVTVAQVGNATIVTSAEGRDTISGFERILFSDATIVTKDGSPLVDDLFYLAANKDVFLAGQDADAHYAAAGAREGRDPNAFFSTDGYLAANPDVRAAGLNPVDHYAQIGWREGRDPGSNFDNELYLARNADVRAAGLNPLSHYLEFGQAEGRTAAPAIGRVADIGRADGFDAQYYLLANNDVADAANRAGGDSFAFAARHFDQSGAKEGRNPNSVFDTKGYAAAYGDVAAAGVNPLVHYDTFGWKEGRDPSAGFDSSSYLAAYSDVRAAQINPMEHYLQFGIYEGRLAFADGTFGGGTVG